MPIEKGNWTTKGCYYYKEGTHTDKVYFSTNGTLDENKIHPPISQWPYPWRPNGFDCKSGKNMLVDRFDSLVNWILYFSVTIPYQDSFTAIFFNSRL